MPARAFSTSFGVCEIAWENDCLTRFRLGSEASAARDDAPPWIDVLSQRVRDHLEGRAQDFADVPYAWEQVSAFSRDVYRAALQVKSGETRTYGWIAAQLGQPSSASRAVGVALAQNPWPLLVPCHRFVGADGRMTGFSAPGGVATKLRLLTLEGAEWFPV
jgi:methylated-DNA-[protein]-cysteine S-methyltransferase